MTQRSLLSLYGSKLTETMALTITTVQNLTTPVNNATLEAIKSNIYRVPRRETAAKFWRAPN